MLCCARADIGADVARRQDELGGPEPCLQIHDGFGFACEYNVERKFCETRLYQVAPIFSNMILGHVAEHVLKLPRSY